MTSHLSPESDFGDSNLMNYVVRMVIPMRREFSRALDVAHFMHDFAYAREILEQAKANKVLSSDWELVSEAVLAGLGIGWLPQLSCGNHIRNERLVAVLPDFCSPEIPVHAVYPTRRQLSPKVVAFVELLAERIQFHDG